MSANDGVGEGESRPSHGGQDAGYGRDAAARKGVLRKMGGSAGTAAGQPNGFDFTKISSSGETLPATAHLGSGLGDWACTYDHNTSLIWEVKVDDPSHLRFKGHTYTWYSKSFQRGVESGGVCADSARCDSEAYVEDVNAAGLCGFNDWRLPTQAELNNLADRGRSSPAIDPVYFLNTQPEGYWSGTPLAESEFEAWMTDFATGAAAFQMTDRPLKLRLVRASQ